MRFADWDLWLFPCSCMFQGQLYCSIFHIPDRKLRYFWHWIWERIRKDLLQNKQKQNQPSPHCGGRGGRGGRGRVFQREERPCSSTRGRPRMALGSALHQHSCLWYRLDLETLFSSVSERRCHKPAMFVRMLVSLSFWQVYGSKLST